MKVLVLGYGSMGRRHAAHARELGHRVAVHDPRPTSLPVPEIQWFASELSAYAWNPDAIVIATPASTHALLYKRAIAACGHVFIEKPLALSHSDFVVGHSDGEPVRPQAHVQVGCNWRFHPLVMTLRHHATLAGIDAPERADFWVLCDSREWPGSGYADALLECGAHEIDLAQYFCGPIVRVADALFVDNVWRLTIAHQSGCTSSVTISDRAQLARGMRITWPTHIGGFHVPYGDPKLAEDDEASYALELQYFLEVASCEAMSPDYGAVPATLDDGIAVLKACDDARELVRAVVPHAVKEER